MGDMIQREFKHEEHIVSSSEIATAVISLKEEGASISEEDAGTGTALAHVGTDEANIVRFSSAETPRAHAQSMDNEQLADYVVNNGWGTVLAKLVQLKPYLEVLWERFESLRGSDTIARCRTKKEFCEKCLNRSIRVVEHMLNGRTPKRMAKALKPQTNSEPSGEAVPADTTYEPGKDDNEEPSANGSAAGSDQPDEQTDRPHKEHSRTNARKAGGAEEAADGAKDSAQRSDSRNKVPDLPPGALEELSQRISQTADTSEIGSTLKRFFEGLAHSLLEPHPLAPSSSVDVSVSRNGQGCSSIRSRIVPGDWMEYQGGVPMVTERAGEAKTLGRVVGTDKIGRPRVRWHNAGSWTKPYSLVEGGYEHVRVLFERQAATAFPEAFGSYPDDDGGASKGPTQQQTVDGAPADQSAQQPIPNETCGDSGDGTVPSQQSLFGLRPAVKAPPSEPAVPEEAEGKPGHNQTAEIAEGPASKAAPTAGPFMVKKRITRDYFDFIVIRNGEKLPEEVFNNRAEAEAFCEDLNVRCLPEGSAQHIGSPIVPPSAA